jgi:hypothetical protein
MNDSTAVAESAPGGSLAAYGAQVPALRNAMHDAETQRAVAEMQTAIFLAKQFPRNPLRARDAILAACTRVSLAETAQYAYTRGSTQVTGPSIRLAEAIAQLWGNIKFGIQEVSQANGESTVKAFAWDLETLTHREVIFQVPHVRYTKNRGIERLTDPRDIYELVANQGARRLRACILAVIQGDIVEAAQEQCDETLKNSGGAPAEQLKKIVAGFAELGVGPEALAVKLGHRLEATNLAEVLRLKKIYRGIRDGLTTAAAEFAAPAENAAPAEPPKTAREAAKRAAAKSKPATDLDQGDASAPAAPEPEPAQPKRRRTYATFAEAIQTAIRDESDEMVDEVVRSILTEAEEALPPQHVADLKTLVAGLLGGTAP